MSTIPAQPGTELLIAVLRETVEVESYPVVGWLIVGGFVKPLTVVPPNAYPAGAQALSHADGHGIVDLKTFATYGQQAEWLERVGPALVAGDVDVAPHPSITEAGLGVGPAIVDRAPGQEDPDKPKRKRRTKEEIAADKAREEAAAAQQEAPAAEDDLI